MIQHLNYYSPNTLAVHLRTWTRKINHGMWENRLPTSIKQGLSLNQTSWDIAMQVRCLQIPEMSPTLHTVPENSGALKRTEIYWPCKPPYNSWWWASGSKIAKLFISVGRERKSYNFSPEKVPMSQEEAFVPPPCIIIIIITTSRSGLRYIWLSATGNYFLRSVSSFLPQSTPCTLQRASFVSFLGRRTGSMGIASSYSTWSAPSNCLTSADWCQGTDYSTVASPFLKGKSPLWRRCLFFAGLIRSAVRTHKLHYSRFLAQLPDLWSTVFLVSPTLARKSKPLTVRKEDLHRQINGNRFLSNGSPLLRKWFENSDSLLLTIQRYFSCTSQENGFKSIIHLRTKKGKEKLWRSRTCDLPLLDPWVTPPAPLFRELRKLAMMIQKTSPQDHEQ